MSCPISILEYKFPFVIICHLFYFFHITLSQATILFSLGKMGVSAN